MSRFARLPGVPFRVWSPPGSPVRIEYPSDLARQAHLEAGSHGKKGNASGTLFGKRVDGGFRVVAARVKPGENDPLLAGLEPVGIFAARARGEVFLTESDLERLDNHAIALVVVAEKAGFFVREADGSIQSVQSYEEFPAPRPVIPSKPSAMPTLLLGFASLGLLTAAFLAPRRPIPISLSVHAEDGGQLLIAWRGSSRGSLDILDGVARISIPVSTVLASATYIPRTADVRIELRRTDGSHEEARFIGKGESQIAREVTELDAEASALRKVAEIRQSREAELEKTIRRLSR